MPRPWRRKYSALFDNLLEAGLTDGQLATLVRLQIVLHRAWRTDPVRCAGWSEGNAERVLTLNDLREATGVASLRKARAKLLALSGCDPYQTGAIEVSACANPGWSSARLGGTPGARSGAQTVRVLWRNFSEILHPQGPPVGSPAGAARPHEGRSTKYEEQGGAPAGARHAGGPPSGRRAGEKREGGRAPSSSSGWDVPPGTPRQEAMTDEQRVELRRQMDAQREKLRGGSQALRPPWERPRTS
jgi:hypothetical protein